MTFRPAPSPSRSATISTSTVPLFLYLRQSQKELCKWTDYSPNGLFAVHVVDMDVAPLTQMIDEILDSSIRLRVVKLLVSLPEKEFTGREIAGLLGVSHSNVQRAFRILVDDGLAFKRRIGRADVFQANKEHFLFERLRGLFAVERELPDRIAEDLRSEFGEISASVVIFGSYSRGTADRRSDLDVLVVTRNRQLVEQRIAGLETDFLRRYGVPLSVKVLSPSELRKKPLPPYLRTAMMEGILISGDSIRKVMTTAG